jgi:hypothetical protein
MSVLCEAISVLVPVAVLESTYPGGVAGYEREAQNQTYCCDGSLTRVGFMEPDGVGRQIDRLVAAGIAAADGDGNFLELAVVDMYDGPTLRCAWLEWARTDDVTRAWIRGVPPGDLATPEGWTPAQFTHWEAQDDGTVVSRTDGPEPPLRGFFSVVDDR